MRRSIDDFLLEHPVLTATAIMVTFFIAFIYVMPKLPEPTVITTEHTFTGQLGMVSYTHSFFGLGGVESTTLSFQNGSDIATFTFNKDLSVTVGSNYTVAYQQKDELYFNVSNMPNDLSPYESLFYSFTGYGKNSTSIIPQNIILATAMEEQI